MSAEPFLDSVIREQLVADIKMLSELVDSLTQAYRSFQQEAVAEDQPVELVIATVAEAAKAMMHPNWAPMVIAVCLERLARLEQV